MVNADDLAAAEADLRHKGMSQEDVDRKMWTEKRNVIGLVSFRGAEGELHRGASVQNTSDVVLRFLIFIFLYITHRMWCSVPQL